MPTQIQPLTTESLKQLLNDFEWDVLDDIKPTADTELTDAVIITGFEVSLGSLAMYIEFFSLKKCSTCSGSFNIFSCFFSAAWLRDAFSLIFDKLISHLQKLKMSMFFLKRLQSLYESVITKPGLMEMVYLAFFKISSKQKECKNLIRIKDQAKFVINAVHIKDF